MNRRDLLKKSAALSFMAAIPFSRSLTSADAESSQSSIAVGKTATAPSKLKPPADGIPVAFLISDGAVVIDFCGPWEIFGNVMPGGRMGAFRLYTVSETAKPVTASGGMKIIPDYTLETAPTPKVIVIPAQNNSSEAVLGWIRKSSKAADVTMSVCTGAYLLAQTGLLAGKAATTHHAAYVDFALKFPDIRVVRGVRFVEDGNLASSGGLFAGMDLALRVVERYYGQEVATQTAYDVEYQSQGWLNPDSNAEYLKVRTTSANNHPLCAVCSMDTDPAIAPSVYKGKTYYFCLRAHKAQFDANPEPFVAVLDKK
jgi:putative intracellular protease/amidase/YHS domain-containing protein